MISQRAGGGFRLAVGTSEFGNVNDDRFTASSPQSALGVGVDDIEIVQSDTDLVEHDTGRLRLDRDGRRRGPRRCGPRRRSRRQIAALARRPDGSPAHGSPATAVEPEPGLEPESELEPADLLTAEGRSDGTPRGR